MPVQESLQQFLNSTSESIQPPYILPVFIGFYVISFLIIVIIFYIIYKRKMKDLQTKINNLEESKTGLTQRNEALERRIRPLTSCENKLNKQLKFRLILSLWVVYLKSKNNK